MHCLFISAFVFSIQTGHLWHVLQTRSVGDQIHQFDGVRVGSDVWSAGWLAEGCGYICAGQAGRGGA